VATQDTITQLIAAIRRVGRVVPGAGELIAAVCTGHDYCSPGKPRIDWEDPQAKDALVSALVNDANALVAALGGRDLDEPAASAVGLLALVAGQDVEPAEGSDGTDGRWRIARRVAEDRVISVHDPDARHTRKSPEARRDGYRAHIVACPETGVITGEKLTKAAGEDNSDAAVAAELISGEAGKAEVYGDSAYGTGDLRAVLGQAGHTAVIKPKPLKPAVEGGFTLDDFTVDEAAGAVTCPAGITRPITARRTATFGAACRPCPLRHRCTTRKDGRSLVLHPHDALLRAARAGWAAQPALREDYAKFRPNVERVISQVASRGGRRLKLRYLGTARNNAWLKNRTAALNLRNLLRHGLHHRNGAWVLA
jgi:Transposase DDE domain